MFQVNGKRASPKKNNSLDYDSDIDPDDLLPVYLDTKAKLFHPQSTTSRGTPSRLNEKRSSAKGRNRQPAEDPETARLLRKIQKIEDDVLFDKYLAVLQWDVRRIQLEKEAAAERNAVDAATNSGNAGDLDTLVDSDDEVSREAAAMGAAILEADGSDDDATLADLFASLPVNEVDPLTGKSSTVINGTDGVKITIRDFGKWTGVNPTRVLEEACRARFVTLLAHVDLIWLT